MTVPLEPSEPTAPLPGAAAQAPGSSGAVAPRRAVALRYAPAGEPGAAPRVVASGGGAVAERILALAGEHGVPVHHDGELLELLSRCDLGDEIPLELYAAVAEVLAFLHRASSAARGD